MTARRPVSGFVWPTREQELLLQAALLPQNAALDAWAQWKARADFELIEPGSQHLMPQVFANLHAHLPDDPLMGRLGGIYRMTWYRNQLLLDKLAKLTRACNEADVSTLLLGDAALALRYYTEPGMRPIRNLEILIHDQHLPRAIRVLEQLDWRPDNPALADDPETALRLHQPARFADTQGNQLVLRATLDDPFCAGFGAPWANAAAFPVNGVAALTLPPAEELLRICVTGPVWKSAPESLWIADCGALLKATPDLDWDYFMGRAQEAHLLLRVRHALGYARTLLGLEILAEILKALDDAPVSVSERFRGFLATRPPSLAGALIRHSDRYFASTPRSASRYLRDLQVVWGGAHLWQLPCYAALKTLRLLKRRRLW